jgi:hypothetical protein
MLIDTRTPWLSLASGELARFDAEPGMAIETTCGALWITQDDDGRDVLLGAGESHGFRRGGRVVVQALEPARLRVRPAPGAAVATPPVEGLAHRAAEAARRLFHVRPTVGA